MTVEEQLNVLDGSSRIIVKEGDIFIFNGFRAMNEISPETKSREVKRLRLIPEVNRRNWKELGLLSPLAPEDTPTFKFSDLDLRLYYVIDI